MVNEILQSIHIIAEESVEGAPYNYCIKAQVIKYYGKGKYLVRTSELSEFTATSLNLNYKYEINDTVWVLVINNMFAKYRYILGHTNASSVKNMLVSPNGTEFELSVDDDGNLTTNRIKEDE
jgi:hypothetical protein